MRDNLPANVEQRTNSGATSISRTISTASVAEVDRLLEADPISARALAERLRLMRQLYYAQDASDAERQALVTVWTDALGYLPAPFVMAAFAEWFSTATHRPTPGHIRARAEELRKLARTRRENLLAQGPAASLPEPTEADREAERERRQQHNQQVAAKLAPEFPDMLNPDGTPRRVRPKRIGTSEADL